METKVCVKCGKELPIFMFNKAKKSKDGLQSYCKECSCLAATESNKRRRGAELIMTTTLPKPEPVTKPTAVVEKVSGNHAVMSDGRVLTRVKTLADYTPRELLAELKARGYVWREMYVKQIVNYDAI